MTVKEAIVKSLDELKKITNSIDLCDYILEKKYADFTGKTPAGTVSAQLGSFIRKGDKRVKRIRQVGGNYGYYLTKFEQDLNIDSLPESSSLTAPTKQDKKKSFEERDLHKLLSSFLKNTDTFSKTIFHEKSFSKDTNQIWTHPDMVGIKFLNLKNKSSQEFLKSINKLDTFKLSSYELKREINSDNELKQAFFQAVSNSSWANYGYLVAFEFSGSLNEEMQRLNQSFGIGIIELNANPYQSKILFPATLKELDFRMIDKLCLNNKEFEKVIEQTEKLLTANERYLKATINEFDDFCDDYFESDTDFEKYCKDKNIPMEEE